MNREFTKILAFAHDHADADPLRLLLQQPNTEIDLRLVAQQLEGQRQASTKWPTLARCGGYFYPPRLNREQSSSEATARYKARLFAAFGGGSFADLTGGMGVDTYFMAQRATHADYYETDEELCAVAEHNFAALGADNIDCHCGDSMVLCESMGTCDLLYIDPARRDRQGRKVAAFEVCTPNLLEHLDMLRTKCRHLLVKASPMVDIHTAVRQLGAVSEVHVVALNGECKEVLFVVQGVEGGDIGEEPVIHCVDIDKQGTRREHAFTWTGEAGTTPRFATAMGSYLYEPNAALMKGGCYNCIGEWFGLAKLARNTHLYTGEQLVRDFPGRVFKVLHPIQLSAKETRRELPEGKAHVMVRNYPLTAAELQKRLKLAEGGDLFVIAATLGKRPEGWLCERV